MRLRVAIGGFGHETNTYADASSGRTRREQFLVAQGAQVLELARGRRTYLGGMLGAAEELDIDAVGTVWAYAQPSGTIDAASYVALRDALVASVSAAAPIGGVCLELHGGAVVDGLDDVEADIARAIRQVAGDVPVTAALDLHGHVTPEMAELFDGLFGTERYPHTDTYERGHEAMALIPRIVAGEVAPTIHVERVPVLLPPTTTDEGSVAAGANEVCARVEEHPDVIDCTLFHGSPYADGPDVGARVVVTTDGDPDLAAKAARAVGTWLWTHRDDALPGVTDPLNAVRSAMATPPGTTALLVDVGDNPGAGAPGDATAVLRALLDIGMEDAVVATICDPDAVRAAAAAGVGEELDVVLGGRHPGSGEPVAARAYVQSLSDGRVRIDGPLITGATVSFGPMARLRLGGVDVLVASEAAPTYGREVLALHGLDLGRSRVVAIKGPAHIAAGFADSVARVVLADGGGPTTLRVEALPRSRSERALWPLDPAATYP